MVLSSQLRRPETDEPRGVGVEVNEAPDGSGFVATCAVCGHVEHHLVREVTDAEARWHLRSRHGQTEGIHRVSVDLDEETWDRLVACATLSHCTPEQVLLSRIPMPMSRHRAEARRGLVR